MVIIIAALSILGMYSFARQTIGFHGLTLTFLSEVVDTPSLYLNGPRAIRTEGDYAYVTATLDAALTIFDISDPSSIIKIGELQDVTNFNGLRYIALTERDYLFLSAENSNKLIAVDISDKANPVIADMITPPSSFIFHMVVDDDYLYATTRTATKCIDVFDISDPTNIAYVASATHPTTCNGTTGITLNETTSHVYAYANAGTDEYLNVIDVSDPAAPTYKGAWSAVADGHDGTNCQDVDYYKDHVYCYGYALDEVLAINVSDPTNPVLVDSIQDPINLNAALYGTVFDDHLFVTSYFANSLTVLDISDPSNLTVEEQITDATRLAGGYDLTIDKNHVYVPARTGARFSVYSFDAGIIQNLSSGFNPVLSTDITIDTSITYQTDSKMTTVRKGSLPLAEFSVDYTTSRDWAELGIDINTAANTSFVHYMTGFNTLPGEDAGSYTLYVPHDGAEDGLWVCPNITTVNDILLTCTGGFYIGINGSNVTKETIFGHNAIAYSGLTTNVGAMAVTATMITPTPTPSATPIPTITPNTTPTPDHSLTPTTSPIPTPSPTPTIDQQTFIFDLHAIGTVAYSPETSLYYYTSGSFNLSGIASDNTNATLTINQDTPYTFIAGNTWELPMGPLSPGTHTITLYGENSDPAGSKEIFITIVIDPTGKVFPDPIKEALFSPTPTPTLTPTHTPTASPSITSFPTPSPTRIPTPTLPSFRPTPTVSNTFSPIMGDIEESSTPDSPLQQAYTVSKKIILYEPLTVINPWVLVGSIIAPFLESLTTALSLISAQFSKNRNLPFMFVGFFKKKRNPWGVVYDSKTFDPVDPAIVTLHDHETGKEVAQAITDIFGRYEFITEPGTYYMMVEKTHYTFPSKRKELSIIGAYDNKYFGEPFTIQGHEKVTFNIPLDQVAADWNEEEKDRLLMNSQKRHDYLHYGSLILFTVLVTWSIFAVLLEPTPLRIVLFMTMAIGAYLQYNVSETKEWGVVKDQSGAPVKGAFITLEHPTLGINLAPAIKTDALGRYNFLVAQGTYRLGISFLEAGIMKKKYNGKPIKVQDAFGTINLDMTLPQ